MRQTPAPMLADFASLIARACVDVAVVDDEVAGYVVYFTDGNTMQLENVAVFPQAAGKGIGKCMLDHVEDQARQLKLQSVSLYTNEMMTENQDYYPRQGYAEIDRAEQDGFRRVFYRKELSA